MRLVVDTNRIVAALVKDGFSRSVILHFDGELITVGLAEEELRRHAREITEKAGISETGLWLILERLFSRITVLDDRVIAVYLDEAKEIMRGIDDADVPFVAAALATRSPIWSDDKHFQRQSRVDVITSKQLAEKLGRGSL
ncbi:TPA: hypothetical protein HA318_05575 [Candidatus Micrarchaeota archaeon]|nr:MAG: hypothetical protein AUJ65_00220 [Candidatus Micrarchaeota archaeon CG1_02_51_15]HII39441.1 hypothetical protein [Candidatus Micrarchaeota archaeon]